MATLQTYRPFKDMWNFTDEIERFMWGLGRRHTDEAPSAWAPAVDICEDGESLRVRAELPGLKKEDVKISVEDGVLTLRGERKFEDEQKRDNYYRIERSYGVFARSFSLPTTVDAEKIGASMKDGVLDILIPKREEAKPREINIEVH